MSELEQGIQIDGRLEFPLGFVEALRLQRLLAGAQVLHRTLLVRALCLNRLARTRVRQGVSQAGTGDRIG